MTKLEEIRLNALLLFYFDTCITYQVKLQLSLISIREPMKLCDLVSQFFFVIIGVKGIFEHG